MTEPRTRSVHFTADMLRAYSRRGNFHSDPDDARALGLPGLVAQGMQVAGPAYGVLLDEWGDEFLTRGEVELKFTGMVIAGTTVAATVDLDGDEAGITVRTDEPDQPIVVVGSARRVSPAARPSAPS